MTTDLDRLFDLFSAHLDLSDPHDTHSAEWVVSEALAICRKYGVDDPVTTALAFAERIL